MRSRRASIVLLAALTAGAVGVAAAPAGPAAAAPSTTEACFTEVAYPVVLRRDATPAEVSTGAARLQSGTTQATFVRGLARSDERSRLEVRLLYVTAGLGAADAEGLARWTARLRAGARVRDVGAAIIASSAVWDVGVERDAGKYVDLLYRNVLGRRDGVPAVDRDYWIAHVATRGREWVARRFFGAFEWRTARVVRLYREILGRAPEPAGQAYWVDRLALLDDVELVVELAASRELRTRSDRVCPGRGVLTVTSRSVWTEWGPVLSGDGDTVAFWTTSPLVAGDSGTSNDLYIWDRSADLFTRVPDSSLGGSTVSAAISDDGDTVTFSTVRSLLPADAGEGPDVYRWDRAGGALTLVSAGVGVNASRPDVSADGRFIAYGATVDPGGAAPKAVVRVFDRTTGTSTDVLSRPADGQVPVAVISGDGSAVAWVDFVDGTLRLWHWDRDSGVTSPVDAGDFGEGGAGSPSLSGDGSLLAFAVDDFSGAAGNTAVDGVYLWDQATGVSTIEVEAPDVQAQVLPKLSADGTRLAFLSTDDRLVPGDLGEIDLFLRDLDTGLTRRIARDQAGARIGFADLSADGRHVALVTNPGSRSRLTTWDAAP